MEHGIPELRKASSRLLVGVFPRCAFRAHGSCGPGSFLLRVWLPPCEAPREGVFLPSLQSLHGGSSADREPFCSGCVSLWAGTYLCLRKSF